MFEFTAQYRIYGSIVRLDAVHSIYVLIISAIRRGIVHMPHLVWDR